MYVWGYSELILESCNCSHLKRYINLFHMPFFWLKTKILVLKILNQMEEEKSLGEDLYSSDTHK